MYIRSKPIEGGLTACLNATKAEQIHSKKCRIMVGLPSSMHAHTHLCMLGGNQLEQVFIIFFSYTERKMVPDNLEKSHLGHLADIKYYLNRVFPVQSTTLLCCKLMELQQHIRGQFQKANIIIGFTKPIHRNSESVTRVTDSNK